MAGNVYDQTLEDLGPGPIAPSPSAGGAAPNPYDALVRAQDDRAELPVRLALRQASDTTPERAAEARRLSLKFGVPASAVERNFESYTQRAHVDQASDLRRDAPALSAWLGSDPSNAALVQDDLAPLTTIERVLGVGRKVVGSAGAGVMGFSQGVYGAAQFAGEAADVVGVPGASPSVAFARESAAIAAHLADKLRGDLSGAGLVERGIYGGIESIGQMAPALAVGAVAGPTAMLSVIGTTTGGQSYAQARAQGVSLEKAAGFGTLQGAIEVATEFIPAHRLLGDLAAKTPLLTTLAHQIASEIPGEEIATVLQDLNEWAVLPANKDRTFSDYLSERPSAAAATAISTIVAVGGTTIAGHATARVLEQLGAGMQESKSAARSPEAVQAFLEQATADGSVRQVYAPIETFTQYWQSKGVDPAAAAADLTGDPTAYRTARETGEDLAIPTARYAVKIAATEHNAFFQNEIRLAPEQMNGREAEAFQQQQQPVEVANATVTENPAAPVRAHILEQLGAAGVDGPTAEAYATLYEQGFQSIAERAGLDPVELFNRYGLTVERPSLAPETRPGDTHLNQLPAEFAAVGEEDAANAERASDLATAQHEEQGRLDAIARAGEVNPLKATLRDARRMAPVRVLYQSPVTQSEPFKKWFGKSTLVDEQGAPRIAYHGTAKDFDTFDVKKAGTARGSKAEKALFFSLTPDTANHSASVAGTVETGVGVGAAESIQGAGSSIRDEFDEAGSVVYPVYLKLENPYVSDMQFYSSTEMAKELKKAKKAGHDGIIFPEMTYRGESDTVAVFSPEQVKSQTGNQGTFDPSDPNILHQDARGYISFGADRKMKIGLLQGADLSTFLHETGHLFLEVLRDVAADANAQPQIAADLATLEAQLFAGATSEVEKHERFARGFEAYLMEGKAPSAELRPVFARFRAWLIGVYKSLRGLNVELTNDVRAVMNRLLASDAALAQAEAERGIAPMFTDARAAGMTDAEFTAYRATVEQASASARETLDRRLMIDVQREQTARWKAQRQTIRDTVEAEIHQQPIYRALAAFRSGTHPDGASLIDGAEPVPMKLSRQAIVAEFGKERLKALPKPLVYAKDGELAPAAAAELFGFSSADELLTAMVNAPPLATAIESETTRRMQAEHGNLLLDGTLHEAAQAAVVDTAREQVIRAELRALAKLQATVGPHVRVAERQAAKERAYERRWLEAEARLRIAVAEGHQQVRIDALREEIANLKAQAKSGPAVIAAAIPPVALITQVAQERVAQTPVRALKPQLFWTAANRAGREAVDAAARQDFDAAIAAQQQQLLNLALYRETTRAIDEVETRVEAAKALDKAASRKRITQAGEGFQDQIDAVLDRYEFATVSKKALDRRADLRKWIAALEADGLPVDLPQEIVDETRRVNYAELTVEALIGVTDGLQQIAHLAQLRTRLLDEADVREFEPVRDGLVASIREHNKTQPPRLEFRPADEKWRTVADWYASFAKLSQLTFELDGAQDGGPMWEAFTRRANAASDVEQTRNTAAGKAYFEILDKFYPGRERLTLNHQEFIPAINASLSKEARLAVALNSGNEQNLTRLENDPARKWSHVNIEAIRNTLDARDWEFVQATWDWLDTYWPEIAAKMERLNGVKPEKVQPAAFVTRFGQQMRGGYYPLMYDSRLTERAQQHEAATDAMLGLAAAYIKTTTKRGHEKARQENVRLSVKLELGVAIKHVEQVIHDLTHHEMLIDTTRLLRDSKVSAAILDTRGDVVYSKLTRILQDIALGGSLPGGRATIIDNGANFLRSRAQIAGLALNFWTALQQPLGLFNGMSRVGPTWVARGMKRWLRDAASMESTVQWVTTVSPMMRERANTATSDLRDVRQALREPGGWFDRLLRTVTADAVTQQTLLDGYTWHIGMAQRIADIPTWLGEYEKQMAAAPADEARAIALADQAVLDSQGGGQIKDLAEVQRGGPVAKLFMTFANYGVTVLNATARAASKTSVKSPASVVTFLGHLSLLYAMPSLLTEMLRCGVGRAQCDDPVTFVERVGGQMLSTALNGIIYVREAQTAVNVALGLDPGARGYEGTAGTRVFQVLTSLAQQIRQHELDENLAKAAFATAGILFRFPAAQVQRSVDGFVALQDGKTQNPTALIFGPPRTK